MRYYGYVAAPLSLFFFLFAHVSRTTTTYVQVCGGSLHHLTRYAGRNQALTCQRANGADCLFAIFGALVPRVVVCGSSVLSGLVD